MQLNNTLVSSPRTKSRIMVTARLGSLQLLLYTHYEFVRQICVGFVVTLGPMRPVAAQRVRKPVWKQHQPAHESSFSDLAVSI
jgi:hypothetical protein